MNIGRLEWRLLYTGWLVRLETIEHRPTGVEIALHWLARLETIEHKPTGVEIALHWLAA